MATIKRFEDILSWQKGRELNRIIGGYIDAGKFKRSFKLIDQVEGSAGSIMDNIAEGFERAGNKEFIQFLYISKGSCGEFRSQLYRALDRKFIEQDEFELLYNLAKEVIVLLQKLIDYLQKTELKGSKFKTNA
ncbi:MAG TPA: four helix bundle protein [Parafilimonas sp.]|nr:four helix bundle protein [Parafilimonas sp.]